MLNFPIAKIFWKWWSLRVGSLLVWSAVLYKQGNPALCGFSSFFWPVADTGLAIWRRWKLKPKMTSQPTSTSASFLLEIRLLVIKEKLLIL